MSLVELLPPPLPRTKPRPQSRSQPRAHLAGSCPLPLPQIGWGVEEAVRAVAHARPRLPVAVTHLSPVSTLTTVVLRSGAHALKVYPPGTDAAHLDRLGSALAGSASALLPLGRAVTTPAGVVTVLPWLEGSGPAGWSELGSLLRRFHDEHATADVPAWRPLTRVVPEAAVLPPRLARVLLEARSRLLEELDEVDFPLGRGVIHGDVSPGNALRTRHESRLIDLDWVAVGPHEYDLASAVRRFRAGEITAVEYDGFCAGYGDDVLGWPGLSVLDRIADLGALAFRIWDCRRHGRSLDWVEREVVTAGPAAR